MEPYGETLHRLVSWYWGHTPPLADDGDWSALGDSAMHGWNVIATKFLEQAGEGRGAEVATPSPRPHPLA